MNTTCLLCAVMGILFWFALGMQESQKLFFCLSAQIWVAAAYIKGEEP